MCLYWMQWEEGVYEKKTDLKENTYPYYFSARYPEDCFLQLCITKQFFFNIFALILFHRTNWMSGYI